MKDSDSMRYPGVSVDTSDGEKVTKKSVEERTRVQNDNPRMGKICSDDPATPPDEV